jgi:hypothetical protein
VISSGSTRMASDIDPNTIGLAGATASQNRAVRAAAAGQSLAWLEPCAVGFRSRWCLPEAAGATGCRVPSGAGHAVTAAADPITRCGRYGSSIGSGAHCARTAAVTGPSPNPAVSARAERRALPGAA